MSFKMKESDRKSEKGDCEMRVASGNPGTLEG